MRRTLIDRLIEWKEQDRTLRLVLSNHPELKTNIRKLVPDWLFEGKIRSFYFYKLKQREET